MSAVIFSDGRVVQLDGRSQAIEAVKVDDVKDAEKLARLLTEILKTQSDLKRRWQPRYLDFPGIDLDATGTKLFRFPHKFAGPVRAWVVSWIGSAAPNIRHDVDNSDNDTVVLTSSVAGTATIRVQEAGA